MTKHRVLGVLASAVAIVATAVHAADNNAARPAVTALPAAAVEAGIATRYAADLEGQLTASGQRYDGALHTAAHRSLPFGTLVRVTDPAAKRSVRVTINDRWGGGGGRIINLSSRAAEELGIGSVGQLSVEIMVETLGTGAITAPAAADPAEGRQSLPARLANPPVGNAGRLRICQNQADILGLQDNFHRAHVEACMRRSPPK